MSELEAVHAEGYLRSRGIPAQVFGGSLGPTVAGPVLRHAGYDLLVFDKADRARAAELADEYAEAVGSAARGGEADEVEAEPDLDRLDAESVGVACPSCGAALPIARGVESCPACGAPVDLVSLIVEHHGPEALVDAYAEAGPGRLGDEGDDRDDWPEDAPPVWRAGVSAGARGAACGGCGFSLAGQPIRGRCPSCGDLFDLSDGWFGVGGGSGGSGGG